MKKMLVVLVMVSVAFMLSGCATKKYCYVGPSLNQMTKVNVGSILIQKVECFGRVTVDECRTSLELIYLGNTGTYIRMGQRSGVRGQMVGSASSGIFEKYSFQASIVLPSLTEFTYPMDSRLIDFQGAKFEVIEIGDTWITFRLISISTIGCDKVNGQEVK